jgi:hypothetical protein
MGLRNGMIVAALGGLLATVAVYAQQQEPEDDDDDAQEQEVAIDRSQLPPAVEKTVAAQAANATVKGFSREVENGQTFYEVELIVDGHARDVLMDVQGNVVEVEEQVPFEKLPAKARTALEKRAGAGTIRMVESLTKQGKLVAYEAHVVTAGKWSEVQVGPNGETLAHEE